MTRRFGILLLLCAALAPPALAAQPLHEVSTTISRDKRGAVVAYALALRLFGVQASAVEMLGYLPVIFFGAATPGPMHSVAIVLWVLLFPERPGAMTAFEFVQHNFFVLFNAAVGLLFLRRATRALFAAR